VGLVTDAFNYFVSDMTILTTLKQTGKNVGSDLSHALESISEGWHELLSRSTQALTRYKRPKDELASVDQALSQFPNWGLLAGEIEETARDLVVRIELPGMDKDDCHITLEGNVLILRGEKRFERETDESTYHVMERAYGSFERSIPLARNVDIEHAHASFKNGVLVIKLPKVGPDRERKVPVT
jgi:HSP20 family protein